MPRLSPRGLLALVLTVSLVGCSGSRLKPGPNEEGEVIEAEGWSPHDPKDLLGTKRASLADAQKKAVERVVGVFISAKTRVAKAVTVDQNILANVSGYVRKYDVIDEREEDGFYKTRIRALVLYQKVGSDLKKLGLMRPPPPPGNPSVAVFVTSAGRWDAERETSAAGALRKALLEKGFKVIDDAALARFKGKNLSDSAAAAGIGRDLGADLVLTGDASVHELRDVNLGGFHSFRSRIQIQVIKPETAQVLASRTREASGLDPVPDVARAKALEIAGKLAGDEIADELGQLLGARVEVTISVKGVSGVEDVQKLIEALRGQPDIATAALAGYRDGAAELQVTTEGVAAEELAKALPSMGDFGLSVKSISSYRIEVEAATKKF
ncbi:MAG: hypothetical protein AUJ52_15085 [Elusimicrobia bacterium CG1_02_63_36]|nr:MAG: hypothetical protein AUJ52_15085 [Elusimicrobia bacterium CG1_02_63_36]PIP84965.1 MAG: hypothetical protein COR54_01220 [Elusimicrobia bacterium CG22_combo_CG10-13_8_21_14_all_63_91]PJA12383.1 MAG: hypothetical protein COX66_17505 [Elusimicrobia bacterium CG_4_10_14_0_2_um_filter_63_34]PJB26162.1 MAG: hypothetical protein CO113_04925 [Elusimicrobia bacterium CG_4_9_14_3_um_filter_62_55]